MSKMKISVVVVMFAVGHALYAPPFKQELAYALNEVIKKYPDRERAVEKVARLMKKDLCGKGDCELAKRRNEYTGYASELPVDSYQRAILVDAYELCTGVPADQADPRLRLSSSSTASYEQQFSQSFVITRAEQQRRLEVDPCSVLASASVSQQGMGAQERRGRSVEPVVRFWQVARAMRVGMEQQHRESEAIARTEQQRRLEVDPCSVLAFASIPQQRMRTPERPRRNVESSVLDTPNGKRYRRYAEAVLDDSF